MSAGVKSLQTSSSSSRPLCWSSQKESKHNVSHYKNTVSWRSFTKVWLCFYLSWRSATSYCIQEVKRIIPKQWNFFHTAAAIRAPLLVRAGWRKVVCCCSSPRRWEAGSPKAEKLMDDDKFMWKSEAHPNSLTQQMGDNVIYRIFQNCPCDMTVGRNWTGFSRFLSSKQSSNWLKNTLPHWTTGVAAAVVKMMHSSQ